MTQYCPVLQRNLSEKVAHSPVQNQAQNTPEHAGSTRQSGIESCNPQLARILQPPTRTAAYALLPEVSARQVPHPETLTRAVQVADLDPPADLSCLVE